MKDDVTVLIPAYNEATRIESTVKALQTIDIIDRIVVIDDGSKDNTYEVSKGLGVEVHRLNQNKGKGYALNFGINKVLENSSIVAFLDGDLGSSSMDARKLIEPLLNNQADVTIAQFPSAKKKGGFGLVKGLARWGVYKLTGKTIYTALSGQRAFKKNVLQTIKKVPEDFGIEVGMIVDILNHGFIVKEVEVNMAHRETGRDLKGFYHRGRQFYQIAKVILHKYVEVKY